MAHDVFISHSSKDKVVADAVCAALEAEKIRCWIAPRDIRSGEHWAAAINNAIKSSKIMVLIFSESSNQSDQVVNELTLAVKSKVTVIPFKIEDAMPQGVMEYYLAATHWLDAMNPPTEKQITKLVETVQNSLGIKVEEVTTITPEKEMPAVPEKSIKREEKIIAVDKKTGFIVAATLVSLLLLFGGYKLLNPVTADQISSQDSNVVFPDVYQDLSEEEILIVNSAEDNGAGTLRQALEEARYGNVILFDPICFPPESPTTIYIKSPLPAIDKGKLTIDASNAGVIIDASRASGEFIQGIVISSNWNVVIGLQVLNCFAHSGIHPGSGIKIVEGINNTIGGDRAIGSGPVGQGNLVAGNDIGIELVGDRTGLHGNNVVTGNLIGTDTSGEKPNYYGGNMDGVAITWGPHNSIIGPDNIIAFNNHAGVVIGSWDENEEDTALFNQITKNSIYENFYTGMIVQNNANSGIAAPIIDLINLEEGIVQGSAAPDHTIEIFSDHRNQGQFFEGSVKADENGFFFFSAGRPLAGPNITATATDADGNTSQFSSPAGQSQ